MARRRQRERDGTDLLCESWAHTRRELLGLREPVYARDYLGSLRSTLGRVKDCADGSSGAIPQHYPEVYTGPAFHVNRAFQAMPPLLKAVMDLHYVFHGPDARKARALDLARREYFALVGKAKTSVDRYLSTVSERPS